MKTKTFILFIGNLLICNLLIAQNINTTLGTLGVFTIKDATNSYLTLSQSTGQVNILKTLRLENTTNPATGVIYKGVDRFIHNYGTKNTFMGVQSGNFTMTGFENTSFGENSLYSNTTGSENTALGSNSLVSNTTGSGITAVGDLCLWLNTTGSNNTGVGHASLYTNTTGSYNTAVGQGSLPNNTAGDNNTSVGFNSMYNNTTGSSNTAVGELSLYTNTTGIYNTSLGYLSLSGNTIGAVNTSLGYLSLSGNTTGSNNTAIGYDAQVPNGTASNQVRIGNTSVTYAGVQVAWTITSDRRLKDNILGSNLGLGFISKLRPVSYIRKNDESGKTEYGLIAQEVEEALREEGVENTGMLTVTDEGIYELRYNDLLAPMVKAIQELKQENDDMKKENKELTEKLAKIEKLQGILVNEINKMKSSDTQIKEVKLTEKQ